MIKEREREWHIRIKDPAIYIYIITNGDGGDHTRRQEALRPKEMMRQKTIASSCTHHTTIFRRRHARRRAVRAPTAYARVPHSRRFVRVLYNIRKPHCRHRTGSPPLIMFLAPQSPHRYSTPRIVGTGGGTADAEEEGVGAEGPAALPPPLVDVEFMLFVSFIACVCFYIGRMEERRCRK